MARHYHVDIARFASKADPKWVDNLLSKYHVPGVEGAKQGLSRRISADGVYHIALIRLLNTDLGLSVTSAVQIAAQLLSAEDGCVSLGGGLALQLDLRRFREALDAAIAEGVESVAPARRGRPPRASNPG